MALLPRQLVHSQNEVQAIKRQLDILDLELCYHQAANPGFPQRDFVDVLLNISPSKVDTEAVTDALIVRMLTETTRTRVHNS